MKRILLFVFFFIAVWQLCNAKTVVSEENGLLSLRNAKLELNIDLKEGAFSVIDRQKNWVILDKARFSFDGWTWNVGAAEWGKKRIGSREHIQWTERTNPDGATVELRFANDDGKQLPEYLLSLTLGDEGEFVTFGIGMKNTLPYDCRLMDAQPFANAVLFPGKKIQDLKTLNGAAGSTPAEVKDNISRTAENSMLLTCLVNGARYSIVWGGLRYDSYYATTGFNSKGRTISLQMQDPTGHLVRKGQEWWSTDTYYLGLYETDPFVALEKYGVEMRHANNASPNLYDFPTLCGWAVGALSKGENINSSTALLKELDAANQCGLTRYTKVAIRLEPDYYCYKDGNTEQGWWDDEHWNRYGHLVQPYDTFDKWCKMVWKNNGIPFTYFQSSMPSDDFAKAHPQWMLGGDISKLHLFHMHHQPYIRYDYTNKDFQAHMLSVWKRLDKDGMAGIKFDYPETAWNPDAKFSDPDATTTSAYRTFFNLARQGLGKDAWLAERNLGECGRPRLDVTAGIVDMQRTTGDTNKFLAQYITTCGLRWYKNRMVFNYYQDSKEISLLTPELRQSMLTMVALTSGMLELATSFELFTPEIVHDVSRLYPMYNGVKSPRPVDAFTGVENPMVYDWALTPDWHQVVFFNPSDKEMEIVAPLSEEMVYGGLELQRDADYYVYDFWNDRFVGKLKGNATLKQTLNGMACAVYSVKKVTKEPQLISTDRHFMQGWMDTKDIVWKQNRLTGKASVIASEPFRMVIAMNGKKSVVAEAEEGVQITVKEHPAGDGLKVIELNGTVTKDVEWCLRFK